MKMGKIFKVNPVCSHLWCELAWNNLEKNFGDCPCHGSRFTYDGKSIYAPSIKNLQSYWKNKYITGLYINIFDKICIIY